MPPAKLLPELAAAGFDGIYLDRDGYEDHGRAIEAELTRRLDRPLPVRADGRVAYFDLRRTARRSPNALGK